MKKSSTKKETIPITILTGFLGSGKTTLLNRLIASPQLADTAVLINEFGDVGVDHLLVDTLDEDIILLESGCVCCNVRDDFAAALLDLYSKRERGEIPSFSRVILETTGIADPTSIHQLILSDDEILKYFHYHQTVTVVDAIYGSSNLDQYLEAVRQVCLANLLVISKTDLVPAGSWNELKNRLNTLNPQAGVGLSSQPVGELIALIRQIPDHSLILNDSKHTLTIHQHQGSTKDQHDNRFSSYCLSWKEAVCWKDFEAWLEGILLVRGDNILRLKGYVHIQGENKPVFIQGVQHSFYPPTKLEGWPKGCPQTELVFITCDFSKKAAIQSFAQILAIQPE